MFSSGFILGGHECLCGMSQKSNLTGVILFTVNYCLFSNGGVSIRFNGKDDNVVLEYRIFSGTKKVISLHLDMINANCNSRCISK